MGAHEAFLLRWDNYLSHIVKEFYSLKAENELVDVTLCCEGRKLGAHKMLLSACSAYFKDLFKKNPCKHPIVIIQNVRFEDLEAIIKYIYHGEVEVDQIHLNSFLMTAELLEIKGLVDGDRSSDHSSRSSPIHESEAFSIDFSHSQVINDEKMPTSNVQKNLRKSEPLNNNKLLNIEPGKKRKLSQTNSENSESEISSCKFDNDLSTTNLCRSTSNENLASHKLIDSESIEIFRIVPSNNIDVGESTLDENEKNAIQKDNVEMNRKGNGVVMLSNSSLVPGLEPRRGLNVVGLDLSPIVIKRELEGEDDTQDVFTNSSIMSIEDVTCAESKTPSDRLNSSDFYESRFACKVCGNVYKHFNSLSSHMKKHKGQTNCPLCLKTLSTRSKLRRHLILNHSVHPNDAADMIPLYSRGPACTKVSLDTYVSI